MSQISKVQRKLLIGFWFVGISGSYLCGDAQVYAGRPLEGLEQVRDALRPMAQEIASHLKSRNETSVVIQKFHGPSLTDSNAGPGISWLLVQELESLQVEVKRRATLGVEGGYYKESVQEKGIQRIAVKVVSRLVDPAGQVVHTVVKHITESVAVSVLLGLTVDLPAEPKGADESHQNRIEQSIEAPQAPTDGASQLFASPARRYGVEILIKDKDTAKYKPAPLHVKNGHAFVQINKGEAYAVRLINNTKIDAAVSLGIDGLSMFAFSRFPYKHVIVGAGQESLITGWHRTNESSNEFLVGEYSESPAGKLLHDPSLTGVITAAFAAAWEPGASPPADEPTRGLGEKATLIGKPIDKIYTPVKRRTGVVRAVVSVRYSKNSP